MPLMLTIAENGLRLFALMSSSPREVGGQPLIQPFSSGDRAYHLLPDLASLHHYLTVLGGRKSIPARAEALGKGTIRGKEPLGVSGGLEDERECFHIPVTEAEAEVQPHRVAPDCCKKMVALVVVIRYWCAHATSMAHGVVAQQVDIARARSRMIFLTTRGSTPSSSGMSRNSRTRALLTRVLWTDHSRIKPVPALDQHAKSGLGAQLDAVAVGVVDIEGLLTVVPGLDLGGYHPLANHILMGRVNIVHLKGCMVGGR